MERFATANRATQRTNTPGVNADPGTLGNVFNNRAGGGVDGIQAVAALNQHAGAELTSRVRTPDMIGVGSEILNVETAS